MNTYINCASSGWSSILDDFDLQVILLRILLIVKNSQQVHNARAMINRELIGLGSRLGCQFIRQWIALVRQRLYLNHAVTHTYTYITDASFAIWLIWL